MLLEDALSIYSKASPFEREYTIKFVDRQFTFTEDFDDTLKQLPDWISEATPIVGGANPLYSPYGQFGANQSYSHLSEPLQALWKWASPKLVVNFSGSWEVNCCYRHKIIETKDEVTFEPVYDVPTITTHDHVLFQLLQGMFLQGIGRSRRAFTLNDLPIVMDADTLASEGETLIDKAMENLQNIQKISTVMGV